MNSAEYVDSLITQMKSQGMVLSDVAWNAALACVGWAYVFGARGQYCTPANRRARYSDEHSTIKTRCKNFDGSGSCSGCKWLPGGKKTRFFDCRGFTYWILLQVYGWKLMGSGATSQWNDENNWSAKGTIDTIPENTLVCLFVKKGVKMEHTGFGLNGQTIECSAGVQHFTTRNKKWTHWGVPKCVTEGESTPPVPVPVDPDVPEEPDDDDGYPMLKRGSKGKYVQLMQSKLVNKGYDIGSYGIDGDFGRATESAVKQFQQDNGLKVDGIVGKDTWAMLCSNTVRTTYTVHIPNLSAEQADELVNRYPGSTKETERG